MNEKQAEHLAVEFVTSLMGRESRLMGINKSSRHPGKWGVIFGRRTREGDVIDGPMVVIVDEETRKASLFE